MAVSDSQAPEIGADDGFSDAAATRLDLDPGVLCSRERLEAIARRAPKSIAELGEVEGLRRWQIEEMGDDFLRALAKK